MRATATREVREATTQGFHQIEAQYGKLQELADTIGRSRGKEKSRLQEQAEKERHTICAAEFDLVESASLRLEKLLHLGNAVKKYEIQAVVKCHGKERGKLRPSELRLPGAVRFNLRLGGRLIVNQAGGILENAGLCLHRHFGFPMLPGSAVKGIAAHAAWCAWRAQTDHEQALQTALRIVAVFGYPTSDDALDEALPRECPLLFHPRTGPLRMLAGAVSFLPAVPADPARVELVTDIVNCHHPDYYQGKRKNSAADDENPNPQFFPAVEAGAEFVFTIVPLRRPLPRALGDQLPTGFCPLEAAREWLLEALTTRGAGAKTAAGYGWFKAPGARTGPHPASAEPARAGTAPEPADTSPAPSGTPAGPDIADLSKMANSPGNFRVLLPKLAALDDATLRQAFPQVFAKKLQDLERKGRRDPYWQSFSSRPEGAQILKRLGIVLK